MGTCGVHAKTENSPTLYPPVQELYSHLEHVGDVQALCGDVQQLVCHACVDALQRLHLARIQFQADLRSQNNQSLEFLIAHIGMRRNSCTMQRLWPCTAYEMPD